MIDAFKEAAYLAPDWAEAPYNLGLAWMVVGQYDDAAEALQQTVKVQPDHAEAHRVLSLVYSLTGKKEASDFHKKEAARLNPELKT